MRVLNLLPLSVTLRNVADCVRYGDHALDFEHEEEPQYVKAFVLCKKCGSEVSQTRQKAALLASKSDGAEFVKMFHSLLEGFIVHVPDSCSEAADQNICREVLQE